MNSKFTRLQITSNPSSFLHCAIDSVAICDTRVNMLIRKNTKSFKALLHLVEQCQDRADRQSLVRLYITKAGQTINERISVEAIEGDSALFYEMTYQAVLANLRSSNHQLNVSDEVPGIYFFTARPISPGMKHLLNLMRL